MDIPDDQENPEYFELRKKFLAAYDGGDPYRDDDYISSAVWVFCIESMRSEDESPGGKAAKSIARRLMGFPELRKEWLVTFPYVWMDKDKVLSESEEKQRRIAHKVWLKVEAGQMVTHATAQVAVEISKSTQKVTKDYYQWKSHFEGLKVFLESSKNGQPKK